MLKRLFLMVIGLRRFHLIKSMTESERQIGFKFSLNEQKLSQQNT